MYSIIDGVLTALVGFSASFLATAVAPSARIWVAGVLLFLPIIAAVQIDIRNPATAANLLGFITGIFLGWLSAVILRRRHDRSQ